MAARSIIIDCDPGQDDAVMLLLALASPEELDVRGITTVAGNVPLDLTQRNARIMCDLAGRTEVPVYAGCPRPMVRDLITAEAVHGQTGIDGIELFDPETPLQRQHAVDFLVEALMTAPQPITLVPAGPLTNIALALVKEPRIAANIAQIVLMGGAWREGGNSSPAAEFNILVDPHAAHVVLTCGRPIVVMSLDVTHQALTTPDRLAAIGAIDTRVGRAVRKMLEFYDRHDIEKYGMPGGPLHDPCTIAYLLRPDLFAGKELHVAVDTTSEASMGATLVDYWGVTGNAPNATWMHTIDADSFYTLLIERLARLK